jgi:hypothetical protein
MSATNAPNPTKSIDTPHDTPHDTPPSPPTMWRAIRAYLSQRESAKYNDIEQYVYTHCKHVDRKAFDNKMTRLKRAGDIKSVRWGVYAITQQGRRDLDGPDHEGLHDNAPQAPPSSTEQASTAKIGIKITDDQGNEQTVYINLKIRVSVEVV